MILTVDLPEAAGVMITDPNGEPVSYVQAYNTKTREAVVYRRLEQSEMVGDDHRVGKTEVLILPEGTQVRVYLGTRLVRTFVGEITQEQWDDYVTEYNEYQKTRPTEKELREILKTSPALP